jgi:hypothetical protein
MMDEKTREEMLKHGWTPEMLDHIEKLRAAGPGPVDLMFLEGAKKALRLAGYGALEFIKSHPGLSTIELAKELNRGASALGLIMAIYEEALRAGTLRNAAKELLIRKIRQEFPEGWLSGGTVGAGVKLGSWDYEIGKYIQDPNTGQYATAIIRHLTIDDPPTDGWKPQAPKDPLIEELFDRYWPVRAIENPGQSG